MAERHAPGPERRRRQPGPDNRGAMKFVLLLLAACLQAGQGAAPQNKHFTFDAKTGAYHVYPNGRIQDALEAAAADRVNKTVYGHAGTYRTAEKGQAVR